MTTTVRSWLDYAQLQSAAECYLHDINLSSKAQVTAKLIEGANNAPLQGKVPNDPILAGATRFTDAQAEWFTTNYEIVTHYPNDSSGFSATLFRRTKDDPITGAKAGEYTLSFRSTEYQFQDKGGDYERDGSEATDGDIVKHGFALAQLASMEAFYSHLKQGETWNASTGQWEANSAVTAFASGTPALHVTGYSLGAHLASAFTLMHDAQVTDTWLYNAAGLGGITTAGYDNAIPTGVWIDYLIDAYNALMNYDGVHVPDTPLWNELVLSSPRLGEFFSTSAAVRGQTFGNVYDNPLHDLVMDLLDPKTYPAGSGVIPLLSDAMGNSRLLDAISNWDPTNLNSFNSDLFEVKGANLNGGWAKIKQFYGHGEFLDMEFVANSGWHVTPTQVFIEDLPWSRSLGIIELLEPGLRDMVGEFGETHSLVPLIDSLTVLDMLQGLDASFGMADFTRLEKAIANSSQIYDSSSALGTALAPALALADALLPDEIKAEITTNWIHDADALENTVNALHKLLLGTDPGLSPDTSADMIAEDYGNLAKRNALHNAIADITGSILYQQAVGLLKIVSLADMNAQSVATLAPQDTTDGLAYRYALEQMNPFVLKGDAGIYAAHNADGHLNADQTSSLYWQDRAAMLGWMMQFNVQNIAPTATPSGDTFYKLGSFGDRYYFEDVATHTQIRLGETVDLLDPPTNFRHIIFGSDNSETLTGAAKPDHLYGNAGGDTLIGNDGDDILEGGRGNDILNGGLGHDIYRYHIGDGNDTLIDPDGGFLFIGDALIDLNVAGLFTPDPNHPNTWSRTLPDGSVLTLTHNSSWQLSLEDGGSIQLGEVLDDFQLSDFGIYVLDAGNTSHTYTDTNNADLMRNWDFAGLGTDDQQNTYTLTDSLVRYQGEGGSDFIQTDQANDWVEAGTGNDFVLAREGGADILYGGDGDDFIQVGDPDPGNDNGAASRRVIPGDNQVYLDGGDGNDTLSVLRSYLPMALALNGGDAGTAYYLADVGDFAAHWATAFSGWSRGDATFFATPGESAPFNPTGWGRDGVILSKDDGGQLNLFATFQFTVASFSAISPTTHNTTDFQPILVYQRDQDNDDTTGHFLDGGADNDMLEGGYGDDFLDGGSGQDNLDGERGDDWLFGGDGDDLILGGEGNDHLEGGTGGDWLIGEEGDDILLGGDGNDELVGDSDFASSYQHGNDQLFGGDGDDRLSGNAGNDWLEGGAGADQLNGGDGNDTLVGGLGVDIMEGGEDDDLYLLSNGDGLPAGNMVDTIDDRSGTNTLEFGPDIVAGDIVAQWAGGTDLVLQYSAQDYVFVAGGLEDAIALVIFSNGEELPMPELLRGSLLSSPRTTSTNGPDFLFTGDIGGSIHGYSGDDILFGGVGDDQLFGEFGKDTLAGHEGNDILYGGDGDDTYLFDIGDGVDTISENSNYHHPTNSFSVYSNDTLQFGRNVTPQDIFRIRNGSDLILSHSNGVDKVIVKNWFASKSLVFRLNTIKFADGTIWDEKMISSPLLIIEGSDNRDDLLGSSSDFGETIKGLGGNDTLYSNNGSDTLDGGEGNDRLYGRNGNDVLIGGPGNDTLDGGLGNDTYYFNLGDGIDTIYNEDHFSFDVLKLGHGIHSEDVTISRRFMDLVLSFEKINSDDKIIIANWFRSTDTSDQLDHIEFNDGTIWDKLELTTLMLIYTGTEDPEWMLGGAYNETLNGLGGDDHIDGWYGDDVIYGGEGNDYIDGGFGNDTLIGGPGDDTLFGRWGSDTYQYEFGDGSDIINSDENWNEADILMFGSGITPDNIIPTRNGLDLILMISNSSDKITILNWFIDDDIGYFIDHVKFSNGIQWTAKQLKDLALTALDGDDIMEGADSFDDFLYGGAGNDTLIGYSGDDTLDGGTGADKMFGGEGNDIYFVDDVNDTTIEELNGGFDLVLSTISWTLGPNVEDLTLVGSGTVAGSGNGLDNILKGNSASNTLYGDAGNDVLRGDGEYRPASPSLISSLVVFAKGTPVDNIFPIMQIYIGGVMVQQFTVDAGSYTAYTVNPASLGISSDQVDIVFTNDTTRPDLGQDRNLFVQKILVNNTALYSTDFGVVFDTGVGGAAFDGMNLRPQGENLYTNGALRFMLTDNDTLDGGTGADNMSGGFGNDTYIVDNQDDLIWEPRGQGFDTVRSSISTTLGDNLESLVLTGFAGINATGNSLDNLLVGNTGANTLLGGDGNDTLLGYAGNDFLDGGAGNDVMQGGQGDDTYIVDNIGDGMWENSNEGTDIVQSSISWTLANNFEGLVLTGSSAINGTGNSSDNTLIGNGAINTLIGGAGNDVLIGGTDGSATPSTISSLVVYARGTPVDGEYPIMQVYVGGVMVQQFSVEATNYSAYTVNPASLGISSDKVDVVFTNDYYRPELGQDRNLYVQKIVVDGQTWNSNAYGVFYDPGTGSAAFDGQNLRLGSANLVSNGALRFTLADNDTLDGGNGADTMSGGLGNDTYLVDDPGDVVVEAENAGIDTVRSSISQTLCANVEHLVLTGANAIDGTGNALDNLLMGNEANNVLFGGNGNDTLLGGGGNDTLDGGSGSDVLQGGQGDDLYIINSGGKSVWERSNEGIDTVESSVNYTLPSDLENLVLTGTSAINGTGNSVDNTLVGNDSNNSLNGSGGNDILSGQGGNDWLVGGAGADYIDGGAGNDWVAYSGSPQSVYVNMGLNQAFGGDAEGDNFNGIEMVFGSSWDDTLIGDSLDNQLQGAAGNDLLNGGGGMDVAAYYSDPAGAVVDLTLGTAVDGFGDHDTLVNIERIGGSNVGNDLLYGDSINNSITGNGGDDGLYGRAGNDWLDGGAGNDTLEGGTGNDTLLGQSGNDTYIFNRGDGSDNWTDSDATAGNVDIARFGADISDDQIWFRQVGNDLEASIIGTTDKTVIKNWYSGSANHIERFESGNGKVLLDSQVDALISVMAGFSPPASGQTTLPANYQQALAPVLAANWH